VSSVREEPVRVLVLEGERAQRESVEAALRARGCEVITLGAAFTILRALEGAGSGEAAPEPLAPAGGDPWAGIAYGQAKEQALRQFEKEYVEAQLRASGENISAAARRAGMDRSNFKRLLRKHRRELEPDAPLDDDLAIG
jgi:transcriptional regulator with GAF, ATPase, and Fis domain